MHITGMKVTLFLDILKVKQTVQQMNIGKNEYRTINCIGCGITKNRIASNN